MEYDNGPSGETILVVPCYNEAARLDPASFQSYAAEHHGVRFLFVNDGSTDDTAGMLQSLHESRPETFLVHELPQNRGKAEAVRVGMLQAIELGGAYVGYWDADLSTPLNEIEAMRAVLESRPEIEMVFGARVNLLGRRVRRTRSRHYIGRVFATLVAKTLRLPVYDTQCGAKLFRANDRLAGLFQKPFISRWIFDVEIIGRAIKTRREADLSSVAEIIYELPLRCWHEVDGSKIRLRDYFIVSRDLLRIYLRLIRRRA